MYNYILISDYTYIFFLYPRKLSENCQYWTFHVEWPDMTWMKDESLINRV